jgi:ribosomal-protein-alanine N-acetyltransferase
LDVAALQTGDAAGRVVGFVVFWNVHDEVQVLDVAVAPAHQRRGIARRLLEEVERRSRARACALLTLEVRRGNAPARALYLAAGFREVGLRKRYYDDGEDAFVLVKDLAPGQAT